MKRLFLLIAGLYILAHGILNLFVGNDFGFGIMLVAVAMLYVPRIRTAIEKKFNISIPTLYLAILALLLVWATLAVGAFNEVVL